MKEELTRDACRAPSLVFIDEIDSITRAREGREGSFDRRTKNRLLEMVRVPDLLIWCCVW